MYGIFCYNPLSVSINNFFESILRIRENVPQDYTYIRCNSRCQSRYFVIYFTLLVKTVPLTVFGDFTVSFLDMFIGLNI